MENTSIFEIVKNFLRKFPGTIAWRIKQNCSVLEKFIDSDEKIIYAFAAQKNDNPFDIITTAAVAVTNKRIMIAQKRVVFGYFFYSITPDMFNDLTVKMGLIWGRIHIDTIKEFITFTNIDKNALPEIENAITEYIANINENC